MPNERHKASHKEFPMFVQSDRKFLSAFGIRCGHFQIGGNETLPVLSQKDGKAMLARLHEDKVITEVEAAEMEAQMVTAGVLPHLADVLDVLSKTEFPVDFVPGNNHFVLHTECPNPSPHGEFEIGGGFSIGPVSYLLEGLEYIEDLVQKDLLRPYDGLALWKEIVRAKLFLNLEEEISSLGISPSSPLILVVF